MAASTTTRNGSVQHWVVARPEPSGSFTAQVVGVPELVATAATREEAIDRIRVLLCDWVATGRLVSVEVTVTNPLLGFTGHTDPNDPLEKEFLENLARYRREDLERTLREDDEACSNSSSTPTT